MKYLEAWLDQPDWMIHPMQAFTRHEDAVEYVELLAWNLSGETAIEYELFYVEGARDRYRDALEAVASIQEYTLAPIDDESFHVYVRQETRPETSAWRDAFLELELIVVPPIRFDENGLLGITIVGDGDDIQQLLADFPEEIAVTVVEIGAYDRRGGTLAGVLTERQLEAASAALEVGYYDVPRSGSLAAVAETLGIAESSASLLLRRAERSVFSTLLDRYSAPGRKASGAKE